MDLYPFFDWLDTSFLADMSKAYGGTFAVIQMFHLMSMALLGGMILVADLRLLGWVLADVPRQVVINATNKWFTIGLVGMILSGIFMSSAVAIKLYYNEMFWAKMSYLGVGIVFVYLVRRPLLAQGVDRLHPWTLRLLASASIVLWFTVAASGRWIGFS